MDRKKILEDAGLTEEDIVVSPWDPAEYLETNEDIRLFVQTAMEEGTEEDILFALKTAARAKGMIQLEKETGIDKKKLLNPKAFLTEISQAFGCKTAAA